MDFKAVDKKFRPVPFWSWNEKLNTDETKRQINLMNNVGMGGFFMHARGGLQTEYMGDDWFLNVSDSIDEAKKLGMNAWGYDENGWPSGFGGGIVNGLGEKYQQKYLRYELGEKNTPNTICNCKGYHFYYDVNRFYVDTLDGEVIKCFIDKIYQPYYHKFHDEFSGFFTDEPQISRDGIPWNLKLPQEYTKKYNEDLLPHLIELYMPVGDYKATRIKFWKLVTDLFSKNYMKQIYDWCNDHNLGFTGHLVIEESLLGQTTTNGACMPHYEYLTIPGMDWLGRDVIRCLTPMQVSSVAHQLGKKQILSETFALCGHNVSFDELRRIYEWQMVHGINLLCPHLEGYSLRGIRKRDYPPAMYYQQPWWDEYKGFVDFASRIGMILCEGQVSFDTLIIHPQTTAWSLFDNVHNEEIDELNNKFLDIIDSLERKHILFHLGDETIMERHGSVSKGKLIIGTQSYSKIIVMDNTMLLDTTKALLREFVAEGGTIVKSDDIPENKVIDNENISYTMRQFKGYRAHYFVNTTDSEQPARVFVNGQRLDCITGELMPFSPNVVFNPYDSIMIIEDGSENATMDESRLKSLSLSGAWEIESSDLNALTLDFCDYYFDGVLQEKNGYVLNIGNRANSLEKKVNIKQDFHVTVNSVPDRLYLVIETPEIFSITVNNAVIDKTDCGYYRDTAFRKLNIAKYIKTGNNTISLNCDFSQSQEVYNNLKTSKIFESEKNKLTYDMEIEAIYLQGNFSVSTIGEFTDGEKKASFYKGSFSIDKKPDKIKIEGIEKQGFPFFSGRMTLKKTIVLGDSLYKLDINKRGINAVILEINKKRQTYLWNEKNIDLSKLLIPGENEVKITLVNNLRNLLGPHHMQEGECFQACPGSFYKEDNIWGKAPWRDEYSFVNTGLYEEKQ